MARTRRTIPLDEKTEKAQELVFQIKDKYDAAVEELNKLIKKKQELQRQELFKAIEASPAVLPRAALSTRRRHWKVRRQ
jgi:hypothetical protein